MEMTRRTALAGATIAVGVTAVASMAEAQEKHPEIRRAIRALERARDYMQHAAHDFGGHRVAALQDCDRAIQQLRLALQFDKS
jgi:hypothetical protein